MKPKHFQNLFSKEPIFEFFADRPAKSFLWVCVQDCSFDILDAKECNASSLRIGDKIISMEKGHILLTGISFEPAQKTAIKCFLESVFSYSSYEDITIFSKQKHEAELVDLIPDSYKGLVLRRVKYSL